MTSLLVKKTNAGILDSPQALLKCRCMKSVQIRSFFWPIFSRIRTEYGDLQSKSPYLVQMRENTDQKKLRIWALSRNGQ